MKKAFTLIELLLVIVLMAMIMAIMIPSFIGLTRGAGMRGATTSINSVVSLSRQWAITHRENVTVRYGEYFNGLHTDMDGSTLVDSGANFGNEDGLKGHVLHNITKGGHGTITKNTATTIDAGL